MVNVSSPSSTVILVGAWSGTGNLLTSNDVYATNTGSVQNTEYPMEVSGFSFGSIPVGATINNVSVFVEAKTGTANRAQIKVELLDGGTLLGVLGLTNLTAADAGYVATASATRAQLQSVNLKVRVTNKRTVSQASTTSVDFIRVDVTYTDAAVVHQVSGTVAVTTGASGAATVYAPLAGEVNLYLNPSAENGMNRWAGSPDNFVDPVTTGATNRTKSLVITPTGSSDATYLTGGGFTPLVAGKTYTVQATLTIVNALTALNNIRALRVAVLYTTTLYYHAVMSERAPNVPGTYTIRLTFTLPADAAGVGIYFYSGSAVVTDLVYWDSFLLVEGVYTGPYFDGATGGEWLGTPDDSQSRHVVTLPPPPTVPGWGTEWGSAWPEDDGSSPIPASGLQGWWDASDTATFTLREPAAVVQWRDKSGQGRHFAQATNENQPHRVGFQLGRKIIDFRLPDVWLDTAAFTVSQPFTVFIAMNGEDAVNPFGWFSSVGGSVQIYGGAGVLQMYSGGGQPVVNSSPNGPHVWAFVFNSAASLAYQDGVASSVVNPGANGTTTGFRLAERDLTPGYRLESRLFEVIVYNRVLSTPEREQVETYLDDKWISPPAPEIHQVSGTVAVTTGSSGTAEILAVTHQVSGTVAVNTGTSGEVRSIQKVAGTVPVVVGTSGTVSALLKVAGTVPVTLGAAGAVRSLLSVAGIVPINTATSGTLRSIQPVSGTVAVNTAASGTAEVVAGAVVHQVSGTVPVTTAASGNVSVVAGAVVHQVSGTVAVTTGTSGATSRRQQVAGTVPVSTAASGDVSVIVGAVIHQVSGTVAVSTAASGAVDVIQGAVVHQVSGTVAVVTGTPTAAIRLIQSVSGTVAVVTSTAGAVARRQQVSGTVTVVTGAAGAVASRQQVSGVVDVVTTARGTVTIVGAPPPLTNVYLGDIPVTLALGDVPVKLA